MKRRDLLSKLSTAAKAEGLDLDLVREGGQHSIYRIGERQFSVPRHNEIDEITAKAIFKQAGVST